MQNWNGFGLEVCCSSKCHHLKGVSTKAHHSSKWIRPSVLNVKRFQLSYFLLRFRHVIAEGHISRILFPWLYSQKYSMLRHATFRSHFELKYWKIPDLLILIFWKIQLKHRFLVIQFEIQSVLFDTYLPHCFWFINLSFPVFHFVKQQMVLFSLTLLFNDEFINNKFL